MKLRYSFFFQCSILHQISIARVVWVVSGGVWDVSGMCLECVREVSGMCPGSVWNVSGTSPEHFALLAVVSRLRLDSVRNLL